MSLDVTIISPRSPRVLHSRTPERIWYGAATSPGAGYYSGEADLRTTRSVLSHAQQEASTLTQDLDSLRSKLHELRVSSELPGTLDQRRSSLLRSYQSAISSPGHTMVVSGSLLDATVVTGLEEGVERVKLDLETETRHRVARDHEAASKLKQLDESLSAKSVLQSTMDSDLRKLEESLDTTSQQLCALREALDREVGARKAAEEGLQKRLHEVVDELRRESKDRSSSHEDLQSKIMDVKDTIHEERTERERSEASLRATWQKELQQDRQELRDLRARLQEAEASWSSQAKAIDQSLDAERAARAAAVGRLEQRLAEQLVKLESEKAQSALRDSMVQDFEQRLRSQKQAQDRDLDGNMASLKDFVVERFDTAKHAQQALRDELGRTKATLEAQLESQLSTLRSSSQASLESKIEPILERLDRCERKAEEIAASSSRSLEACRASLETSIQDSAARERTSREAALDQIEQRERAAKNAQSDQAREQDGRLAQVRSQVEELSERLRSELAAKGRELQGQQNRAVETMEARCLELQQAIHKTQTAAEARLSEEATRCKAEAERCRADGAKLEERLKKVENFTSCIRDCAGR
eukprot:TRINITY_DN18316_c0_g1_i1.p1 TRINITY_DN18316_c0_g1~~TRINITY_DN18316_c0_g1_i1.p1  ORF type:complete len:598 (-),score=168.57 TRINITY_DN18316_c0_g1_i1:177-1940(-)